MKRLASLITAFALALQASGSAFAAANRLIETHYNTSSMTDVTFDYDDADRMIEMVDGTGTTDKSVISDRLRVVLEPNNAIKTLFLY